MALKLEEIRTLAERVAASHGLDVVDVEYLGGGGKHRTLRVFIEKNERERAKLRERVERAREARALAGRLEEARQLGRQDSSYSGDPVAAEMLEDESAGLDLDRDGDGDQDGDRDQSDPSDEGEVEVEVEGGEQEPQLVGEQDLDGEEELLGELDLPGDEGQESDEGLDEALLEGMPSVENLELLSGISHGDCEVFSRDFGMVLDVEELVPGTEYLLEVSSPGLDRRLTRAADYRRFQGSLVKLQTFEPVGGSRHWQGRVVAFENDQVVLETGAGAERKRAGKKAAPKPAQVEVPFGSIEKAQLVPEF